MSKPTLTSIEGGKKGPREPRQPPEPPDYHGEWSRQHLYNMILEVLRALARGDDAGMRTGRELLGLLEHLPQSQAPFGQMVDEVIRDLHKDLTRNQEVENPRRDREQVVVAALQVAAETCAADPAAKGRASKRWDRLERDIERYVLERERRSRENGWSYFDNLLKQWGLPSISKARKR